jgi:hypothetical protein
MQRKILSAVMVFAMAGCGAGGDDSPCVVALERARTCLVVVPSCDDVVTEPVDLQASCLGAKSGGQTVPEAIEMCEQSTALSAYAAEYATCELDYQTCGCI